MVFDGNRIKKLNCEFSVNLKKIVNLNNLNQLYKGLIRYFNDF